jgi:acetyl-CoA synthetase
MPGPAAVDARPVRSETRWVTEVERLLKAASEDPDDFWASAAKALPWHRPWDRVFEWNADRPDERGRYFRWFGGGETNLGHNCVDGHVEAGHGEHVALVCLNERGERDVLTYGQLRGEVRRTAGALRGLGIGKGDRVGVYMPTCREAIVLMLACQYIGAVHLVVFAGFGAGAWRPARDVGREGPVLLGPHVPQG